MGYSAHQGLLMFTLLLLCIAVTPTDTRNPSLLRLELPRLGLITDLKARIDQHKSGTYLLLPHIYRAFIYAGASRSLMVNASVSKTCLDSLEQYYVGLQEKKAWAWKMYDSTGKQESGVFVGATTWTGNYDECLTLVIEDCSGAGESCLAPDQPSPQYCSVYMTHAPWMPKLFASFELPFPVPVSPFSVDVCVPKNCSNEDIEQVVKTFLKLETIAENITVTSVRCHVRKDIREDVPAVISALILFSILGMVVIGTAYDLFLRRRKPKLKRGPEITIGYDEQTDQYGILKILVSPKKRRGRRGTLSSSEPLHKAALAQIQMNGTDTKSMDGVDGLSHPIYKRMTSHTSELQDIPEDAVMSDSIRGNTSVASLSAQEGRCDDDTSEIITSDGATDEDEAFEMFPLNHGQGDNSVPARAHGLSPIFNRQASIIEVRPSHKSKPLSPSTNLLTDLLLSFSFRKNARHILADGSADTLFCLNGVRVLSIAWIVLGNVYGIMYQNPSIVDNDVLAVKMTQSWWMQCVLNTTLAADSFFVLSGVLGAYNFLRVKTKEGKDKETDWRKVLSIKEYLFLIVHRLVRIFPCYAVLLLLGTNLMPYLGSGPRWSYEIQNVKLCKKNWWANALFISNFYNPDQMCLPHTYYLANDFQFFLISPLVLIPLLIKPVIGLSLIGFFVAVQIVMVSALNQGSNGNVLRMRENDYWSLIYVKPYSRIGVYCIGLGLGYLLYKCDRHMEIRKIPLYIGWCVSILLLLILPYITYLENREGGRAWNMAETGVYEALSRPLWALALSWLIFACSTGQGAFVGKLLSWNSFLPLCRITYGVFLLHPIWITAVIESTHHNVYLNFGQLVYIFVALLVFSYGAAFILISCVECPFTTFESHIRLRYKTWKDKRKLKKLQDL